MTTIREILKNITNEDFLYCKEQSNCKDEFIRLLLIKIDEKYEEECWTCGVLPAKNETYRDALGEIEYTCDSCHSKEYEEEEENEKRFWKWRHSGGRGLPPMECYCENDDEVEGVVPETILFGNKFIEEKQCRDCEYCEYCGGYNSEDEDNCDNCGRTLEEVE